MKFIVLMLALMASACTTTAPEVREEPPPQVEKDDDPIMCTAALPRIEYTEGTRPGEPEDGMAQRSSLKRCRELYPNSPCVKKIVKQKGPHYNVICTGPRI